MGLFWFVLALVLVLAALLVWRRGRAQTAVASARRQSDALDTLSAWQPQASRVLRPAEQLALVTLSRALPEFVVLAQVPLARFIRVPQRHSYSEWLRRVGQLSPDFIICDTTSEVLAAVEVSRAESKANERAERRLERMRRVLKAAGIPFHVWEEGQLPTVDQARTMVLPKTDTAAKTPAAPPALKSAARPESGDSSMRAPNRVPTIVDTLDDDAVLHEPAPSSWFDDDYDPDGDEPPKSKPRQPQPRR